MFTKTALASMAAALTLLGTTASQAELRCEPGWVLNGNMCEPSQSVGIIAKRHGDTLDLGGGNILHLRPSRNAEGSRVVYKNLGDRSVMVVPYEVFQSMGIAGNFNSPAEKYWR